MYPCMVIGLQEGLMAYCNGVSETVFISCRPLAEVSRDSFTEAVHKAYTTQGSQQQRYTLSGKPRNQAQLMGNWCYWKGTTRTNKTDRELKELKGTDS